MLFEVSNRQITRSSLVLLTIALTFQPPQDKSYSLAASNPRNRQQLSSHRASPSNAHRLELSQAPARTSKSFACSIPALRLPKSFKCVHRLRHASSTNRWAQMSKSSPPHDPSLFVKSSLTTQTRLRRRRPSSLRSQHRRSIKSKAQQSWAEASRRRLSCFHRTIASSSRRSHRQTHRRRVRRHLKFCKRQDQIRSKSQSDRQVSAAVVLARSRSVHAIVQSLNA